MNWTRRLREAKVPESVILRFYKRYGEMPDSVVDALLADDRKCGIGPVVLGTDPACELHDIEMLLARMGYPIASIPETQGRFLMTSIAIGIVAAGTALVAIPKGVIGATVGGIIQIVREVF